MKKLWNSIGGENPCQQKLDGDTIEVGGEKKYETLPGAGQNMNSEEKAVTAKRVVSAVLDELQARSGFDHWWDDLCPGVKLDIIRCAESNVERVL